MHNFVLLIEKIFPIYFIILLGVLAGKLLHVERDSIAKLAIYFVAPMVVFHSFATMPAGNAYLLIPVIFFVIAMMVSSLFFLITKFFIHNSAERHLLAAGVGTSNAGYFGLPLVIAMLGNKAAIISVIASLGLIVYENTFCYFMISKGHHTTRQALINVATLPAIYTCILGIIINRTEVKLSEPILNTLTYFRGAYVVLGMMIVGLGLGTIKRAHIDMAFTSIAFVAKFLIYPIAYGVFIYLDNHYWNLFSSDIHNAMLVLSATPMAANTIAFASRLKVSPEKISFTVFASTIFAIVFLPIFIAVFVQ